MEERTGKKMMPPVQSSIVLGFNDSSDYGAASSRARSRYESNQAANKKDEVLARHLSLIKKVNFNKFDRSKSVQRVPSFLDQRAQLDSSALLNNIDLKNPHFKGI